MAASIADVSFAVVCGSANWGFRFPEDLERDGVTVIQRDLAFDTPWGETREWKLVELASHLTSDGRTRRFLTVFSHGWPLDRIDHGAHRRIFWVLKQAGVSRVLACSTAGGLNRGLWEGDLVVASDILELTASQYSIEVERYSFDASGKQLVCPVCADLTARLAEILWPGPGRVYGPASRLVAGHSWGPRLQSPAEAAAYRLLGADFINHSLAPEATLAREIGACFVNVTFLTAAFNNYFAPPDQAVLGPGVLERLVPYASDLALKVIAAIPAERRCLCAGLHSPKPPERKDRR